jgi:hypothetical protein
MLRKKVFSMGSADNKTKRRTNWQSAITICCSKYVGAIHVPEFNKKFIPGSQETVSGCVKLDNTKWPFPEPIECPLNSPLSFIPLDQVGITFFTSTTRKKPANKKFVIE